MPFKLLKPCRVSGCPGVTSTGYCEDHKHLARAAKRKKKVDPFYSSTAWKKSRIRYRAKHPLCERCYAKGIVKPANMVHHRVPIEDGGAKLAESNFESICWACHGEIDHGKAI